MIASAEEPKTGSRFEEPSLGTRRSILPPNERHLNALPVMMIAAYLLILEDETRLERDETHINALAEDFRRRLQDKPNEHPIQNPLRVIRWKEKHRIIAGGNRYLAGLRIPLVEYPCCVLPDGLDEAGILIEQAKDNEMRKGYSPIERARNICRLAELRTCSHAKAGALLGIKAPDVTKLMKVLNGYPEELWRLIGEGDGHVGFTTAYTLARLNDRQSIIDMTDKVCKGLLTRDACEEQVSILLGGKKKTKVKAFKAKTAKGISAVIPAMDYDAAVSELMTLVEAVKRAQKHGLPLSTLQQMLRTQPPA